MNTEEFTEREPGTRIRGRIISKEEQKLHTSSLERGLENPTSHISPYSDRKCFTMVIEITERIKTFCPNQHVTTTQWDNLAK